MNHNYCIILAGGSGVRLWPVSRANRPKQFLNMMGYDVTFLRSTYERFAKIIPAENIIVSTTQRYVDLVKEQIPELPQTNIFAEPYARSTAPAIALAAYKLLKRDPDAAMVVTPSDHLIKRLEDFQKTIKSALDYAKSEKTLVAIGVKPTRPDSNYGYIQVTGGKNALEITDQAIKVKTFIEKPNVELARVLIESGEFFWNSGIYVWTAQTIAAEMSRHLPEVTRLFNNWEKALDSRAENDFINYAFAECPNISIDYGVMEKTDNTWLYPASFDWADIGSWSSLQEFWPDKDMSGNAVVAEKLLTDGSNNILISENAGKLIAIKGLDNFMVVDTAEVLLVCPKDDKLFKNFISDIGMPEYEKYK